MFNFKNMKKIFVASLCIALFSISGCAIKNKPQGAQPSKNIIEQSAEQQNMQPTTTQPLVKNNKDTTSDWEIYKNKKIGFEINYLKSLKVIEENESIKFARNCSQFEKLKDITPAMRCQIEGDFIVSLYSGTMKKFIEDFKNDCDKDICLTRIVSQDEYILDNTKATKLTGTTAEGAVVINYLFATKNNKNYLISFNNYVDEYTKMILSFKFLK